jgi:hypothetical protein
VCCRDAASQRQSLERSWREQMEEFAEQTIRTAVIEAREKSEERAMAAETLAMEQLAQAAEDVGQTLSAMRDKHAAALSDAREEASRSVRETLLGDIRAMQARVETAREAVEQSQRTGRRLVAAAKLHTIAERWRVLVLSRSWERLREEREVRAAEERGRLLAGMWELHQRRKRRLLQRVLREWCSFSLLSGKGLVSRLWSGLVPAGSSDRRLLRLPPAAATHTPNGYNWSWIIPVPPLPPFQSHQQRPASPGDQRSPGYRKETTSFKRRSTRAGDHAPSKDGWKLRDGARRVSANNATVLAFKPADETDRVAGPLQSTVLGGVTPGHVDVPMGGYTDGVYVPGVTLGVVVTGLAAAQIRSFAPGSVAVECTEEEEAKSGQSLPSVDRLREWDSVPRGGASSSASALRSAVLTLKKSHRAIRESVMRARGVTSLPEETDDATDTMTDFTVGEDLHSIDDVDAELVRQSSWLPRHLVASSPSGGSLRSALPVRMRQSPTAVIFTEGARLVAMARFFSICHRTLTRSIARGFHHWKTVVSGHQGDEAELLRARIRNLEAASAPRLAEAKAAEARIDSLHGQLADAVSRAERAEQMLEAKIAECGALERQLLLGGL